MAAPGWWNDPVDFKARLDDAGTISNLSLRTGVPRTTLRDAKERHVSNGAWPAEAVTHELDADDLADIPQLLASRGMNPDEWLVDGVTVNEWTQADGSLARQLKVRVRPSLAHALLKPAEVAPLSIPKRDVQRPERASRLVFVYGDDQRPNVDRGFEQLKLQWLRANQPELIVDLGDGMDFPTVSGHKTNPAMNWSVQECANDYASWLFTMRGICPDAEITVLADNHAAGRLRDYQLANAASIYGVKPAEIEGLAKDGEPLLSIPRLLRLDEMGVKYVAPPGDTHYAESHYELVPDELVALHGYRTGSNLGKKFLDDYGVSVIYGHQHGQDVYVTDTKRRGIGRRKRLYALGVGCGSVIHGGGGFAPGADWQNSCLTVSIFPDGGWTWDYVSYEHGVLRWRDQEYRLEESVAA